MKKALCALLVLCALLPGCAPGAPREDSGRVAVIASLFPQYDFARTVGGDRVSVTLLLPPGTETHTFDPKPSDMADIYLADLFVYTGPDMEPWAARLLDGAPETLSVADLSDGVIALREEHGGETGGPDDDGHDGHAYDPHIWLDPTLAMVMADNITRALCALDREGEDYYMDNAARLKESLQKLDDDIWAAVRARKTDAIVFGGRFAHLYFLKRYDLPYRTAYDTCSAQSEPSLLRMDELSAYIKEHNIPCVYHEELAEPRVAQALCEQTGARCLLFSTAHNVTKKQFDDGITYLDVMYQNLDALKVGLGVG